VHRRANRRRRELAENDKCEQHSKMNHVVSHRVFHTHCAKKIPLVLYIY
jgi:hypothetical protein